MAYQVFSELDSNLEVDPSSPRVVAREKSRVAPLVMLVMRHSVAQRSTGVLRSTRSNYLVCRSGFPIKMVIIYGSLPQRLVNLSVAREGCQPRPAGYLYGSWGSTVRACRYANHSL